MLTGCRNSDELDKSIQSTTRLQPLVFLLILWAISFTSEAIAGTQSTWPEINLIAIGLNAPEGTGIVFTANIRNLDSDVKVYLEDRLTHAFIRLDEPNASYSVTSNEASQGTGRFFLVTNSTNLEVPGERVTLLKIIPVPRENKIRILGNTDFSARLTIMDAGGRIIFTAQMTEKTDNELSIKSIQNGFYFISIRTPKETITQKMVWVN